MNCPLCFAVNEHIVYQNDKLRIIVIIDYDKVPVYYRVIWQKHQSEMTDLSPEEQNILMDAVFFVEKILREELEVDKINLVSLGNQVPHIHWHIIARFTHDAFFPNSIWSEPLREDEIYIPVDKLERINKKIGQYLLKSID